MLITFLYIDQLTSVLKQTLYKHIYELSSWLSCTGGEILTPCFRIFRLSPTISTPVLMIVNCLAFGQLEILNNACRTHTCATIYRVHNIV